MFILILKYICFIFIVGNMKNILVFIKYFPHFKVSDINLYDITFIYIHIYVYIYVF
jgi:hypothetical protein